MPTHAYGIRRFPEAPDRHVDGCHAGREESAGGHVVGAAEQEADGQRDAGGDLPNCSEPGGSASAPPQPSPSTRTWMRTGPRPPRGDGFASFGASDRPLIV